MNEPFNVLKNFCLLFRTRDLSPPIIEVISFAFGTAKFGWQVIGAIKTKTGDWKKRKEIYYSLFGFCLNADFITNIPPKEERKKGVWAVTDLYATEEAVGYLLKGFSQKPRVAEQPHRKLKPDFERNMVSLGGPCHNKFSRWMMRLEPPPSNLDFILEDIPELPFVFDLGNTKNPPIKKIDGKPIYIPEIYYDSNKERICKRDYGMIVKMRSFQKDGRREGRWNLMLAGCHGGGTLGVAKALGEEKLLQEIWNKVKTKDFQAIVAVDTETEEEKVIIEGIEFRIKVDA